MPTPDNPPTPQPVAKPVAKRDLYRGPHHGKAYASLYAQLQPVLRHAKPSLTAEQERQLLQQRPDSLEQLTYHYLRLIAYYAVQQAVSTGTHESVSDYFQEGWLGFRKAVERFDLSYESNLYTYACWWILQSIRKYRYNHRHAVRIPQYMQVQRQTHGQTSEKHQQEYQTYREVSLDVPVMHGDRSDGSDGSNGSDGLALSNTLEFAVLPADVEHRLEVKEAMGVLSRGLSSQEYQVLVGYAQGQTYQQLADSLGVSRQAAHYTHGRAYEKARALLHLMGFQMG